MSNTFASIDALVSGGYKTPNFTRCEVFNPKAVLSRWAPGFVCVKNGVLAHGGSGAIAFAIASRGKDSPDYGIKSFEIVNCRLRTIVEFNGPPIRQNVLGFTCDSDSMVCPRSIVFQVSFSQDDDLISFQFQERYFAFAQKEQCDIIFKVFPDLQTNTLPVSCVSCRKLRLQTEKHLEPHMLLQ